MKCGSPHIRAERKKEIKRRDLFTFCVIKLTTTDILCNSSEGMRQIKLSTFVCPEQRIQRWTRGLKVRVCPNLDAINSREIKSIYKEKFKMPKIKIA